jgi:peptidoglycan/xylan/chitin deacetylase (PgdA/CDA1 family)
VAEELDRGRRAVEAAAGRGTGLFRCPYGGEPPFLGELCRERGLRLVRWSVDGEDWRGLSARAIADRIIQGARDGDVVLLHDGEGASQGTDRSRTVEAVRILLAEMTAGGWRFVTVPELD